MLWRVSNYYKKVADDVPSNKCFWGLCFYLIPILGVQAKSLSRSCHEEVFVSLGLFQDMDDTLNLASWSGFEVTWGMAVLLFIIGGSFLYFKKIKKLNQENFLKRRVLENVSEEIRSSINGMVGLARLLGKTRISGEQQECLDLMQYSSEQALNLLNNVMVFSKIESGKLEIETVTFDLYSNMREVVMQHIPDAKEKDLGLNFYYETGMQKYFMGDPNLLQLIIHNLIRNAIQFTEEGTVSIEVVDHSLPEDVTGKLAIYVRDTGKGISSDELKKIFKTIALFDQEKLKGVHGSGIGLFVSQSLVKMMGGELKVESAKGEGSEFALYLDLKKGLPLDAIPSTVVGRHIGCPYEKEFFPVKQPYFSNSGKADEKTRVLSGPVLKAAVSKPVKNKDGKRMEALLMSLLKCCPWGEAKKGCPLCELRKLPYEEGCEKIREMSRSEKIRICETHQVCTSRR